VNPVFFKSVTTFIAIYHYLSKVSSRLCYGAVSLGEQFLRPRRIVLLSSSSSISPRLSWTSAA
jgi:hypothetical protein